LKATLTPVVLGGTVAAGTSSTVPRTVVTLMGTEVTTCGPFTTSKVTWDWVQ
jgi:hypothetical protein